METNFGWRKMLIFFFGFVLFSHSSYSFLFYFYFLARQAGSGWGIKGRAECSPKPVVTKQQELKHCPERQHRGSPPIPFLPGKQLPLHHFPSKRSYDLQEKASFGVRYVFLCCLFVIVVVVFSTL